jgi:hypothetical protein
MREKDIAERASAGVRGRLLLHWRSNCRIYGLEGRIYDSYSVARQGPELWSKTEFQQQLGIVVLVLPQIRRYLEIPMLQYIGHGLGTSRFIFVTPSNVEAFVERLRDKRGTDR